MIVSTFISLFYGLNQDLYWNLFLVTIQPTKNQLVNIDFDITDKFEYKILKFYMQSIRPFL